MRSSIRLCACLLLGVPLQAGPVVLSLERSTDGLANWHEVPLSMGLMSEEGKITLAAESATGFYRMRIAPSGVSASSLALVFVEGGTLPSASPLGAARVFAFYIGRTEVTYGEWLSVRSFAVANGYDLANIGLGAGAHYPVRSVSWQDALKWCNAKSEMEGLQPVYLIDGAVYRTGEAPWHGSDVTVDILADGYRLPTEAEWEWAARGGLSSEGFVFSGGNDLGAVGWYDSNPGGGEKTVASKAPNELGIYDMSGNVREWCWDSKGLYASLRTLRGGSWGTGPEGCAVTAGSSAYPHERINDIGFRVVR